MKLKIFTDGGSSGNPGPAAVGAVVLGDDDNCFVKRLGKKIGLTTNNVAEYTGIIEALRFVLSLDNFSIEEINFFSDSQLVVNQLKGIYRIKDPNLKQLVKEVRSLEEKLNTDIKYHLIPREMNTEADKIVKSLLV